MSRRNARSLFAVVTVVAVLFAFGFPTNAIAGPAKIRTTDATNSGPVNQYKVGEWVWISGEIDSSWGGNASWAVTYGPPAAGAVQASGTLTVNPDGTYHQKIFQPTLPSSSPNVYKAHVYMTGGSHTDKDAKNTNFNVSGTAQYTLTVSVVGTGTTSPSVGSHTYDFGTTVPLSAVAGDGWTFEKWVVDGTEVFSASTSVTMTEDKTAVAYFTQDPVIEYTLTVTVVGNGSVLPAGGTFAAGTVVMLEATPDSGHYLQSWSGDLSGSATTEYVTMDSDKSVTATFAAIPTGTFSLTVNVVGQGSYSLNPTGGVYEAGTQVTLTAIPATGWHFVGWTGDLVSTDNPEDLLMDADKTVTATFAINTYTLTTVVDPTGSGTINRSPDQTTYNHGTAVILEAVATTGYTFSHWTGHDTAEGNLASVTMTSDKTVTAYFTLNTYVLTTVVNPVGAGTINRSPDQTTYNHGTAVALEAVAATGYTFSHWTGHDTAEGNLASVTMTSDKTVTAYFTLNTYVLTTVVNPVGAGTINRAPDQTTYNHGTTVALEAVAATGYEFSHWDGVDSHEGTWASVTMTANRTVTAYFEPLQPGTFSLTVNVVGQGGYTLSPTGGVYEAGTEVTLTAVPAAGWNFVGWSGGLVSTANPASLVMDANKTVTVTFAQQQPPPGPTGTLTVRVVKTDAGNVIGLPVTIGGAINATLTTNASGVVNLAGLYAGTYTANSGDAGYTSDGPRSTTLVSDSASGEIVITLTPIPPALGAIHGIVIEEGTEDPLAGATVAIFGPGGVAYTTVYSDADGEFHVADVPPGQYTAVASLEGYDSDTAIATVVAGATAEMVLVLAQIIVIPPEPPAEPELPKTGATYLPTMAAGLGLIVAGLGIGRRRSR